MTVYAVVSQALAGGQRGRCSRFCQPGSSGGSEASGCWAWVVGSGGRRRFRLGFAIRVLRASSGGEPLTAGDGLL